MGNLRTLKIDPTFIRDLSADQMSAPLSQSWIEMAHSLHVNIVAEESETTEQLESLRRQGCDVVQRHLASSPLPKAEFAELLGNAAPLLRRWPRRSEMTAPEADPMLAAAYPPTPRRPERREAS